eukprot:CAMPEP_0185028650 /NCGR_PEP_ID=MMETSP1103-20130426/14512_1 /TAXON_ID=36769 /ORGANISM="Paraphysomonas bandaiensis, Strain Caron Lab Isolate" /LENGTH=980 /DNA_ID=CAMNT_0027563133 /DNA_START=89 /DNA_END=3028 /DNA_ORIENTATION=+
MPANIALNLHLDSTVKELAFDVKSLLDRVSGHDEQLRELRDVTAHSTTKAELHAVMASLSYKQMNLALPPDTIKDIIGQRFKGKLSDEEERSSPESKRSKQGDISAFLNLSNPLEAIAAMSERIKKLELNRSIESNRAKEEEEKLMTEIASLRRTVEDTGYQLFKLQNDFKKMKIVKTDSKRYIKESNVGSYDFSETTDGNNTISRRQSRSVQQDTLSSNLSVDTQDVEDVNQQPISKEQSLSVTQENDLSSTGAFSRRPSVSFRISPRYSLEETPPVVSSDNYDQSPISTQGSAQSLFPSNAVSTTTMPDEDTHEDQKAVHEKELTSGGASTTSQPFRMSSPPPRVRQPPPSVLTSFEAVIKPSEMISKDEDDFDFSADENKSLERFSEDDEGTQTNEDRCQGPPARREQRESFHPSVSSPHRLRSSFVRQITKTPISTPATTFVSDAHMNQVVSEQQKKNEAFESRISALESKVAIFPTLHEALLVLSQEHGTLTAAHQKLVEQSKATEQRFLAAIDQISGVVEKCLERVNDLSNETTAMNASHISALEVDTIALKETVEKLQAELAELKKGPKPNYHRYSSALDPGQFDFRATIPGEGDFFPVTEAIRELQSDVTSEQLRTLVSEIGRVDVSIKHLQYYCNSLVEQYNHRHTSADSKIRIPKPVMKVEVKRGGTPVSKNIQRSATGSTHLNSNIRGIQSEIISMKDDIEKARHLAMASMSVATSNSRKDSPPPARPPGITRNDISEGGLKRLMSGSVSKRHSRPNASLYKRAATAPESHSPSGYMRAEKRLEEESDSTCRLHITGPEPPVKPPSRGVAPPGELHSSRARSSHRSKRVTQSGTSNSHTMSRPSDAEPVPHVQSALLPGEDDGLHVGESSSSLWGETSALQHALLEGSLIERDMKRYDKNAHTDEVWFRSYDTPNLSKSPIRVGEKPTITSAVSEVSGVADIKEDFGQTLSEFEEGKERNGDNLYTGEW